MSENARVRQDGQYLVVVAGPHEGQTARSLGGSGRHEVRIFLFGASREAIVDVSDVALADDNGNRI